MRNGADISITMSDVDDEHWLLARLGTNGPVMATTRLDGFWLRSTVLGRFKIVETYADGSALWENTMVCNHLPTNVYVELKIFVGGVTFDDMTIVRQVRASDLDELGCYTYRMIRGASVQTSDCHTTEVYDEDPVELAALGVFQVLLSAALGATESTTASCNPPGYGETTITIVPSCVGEWMTDVVVAKIHTTSDRTGTGVKINVKSSDASRLKVWNSAIPGGGDYAAETTDISAKSTDGHNWTASFGVYGQAVGTTDAKLEFWFTDIDPAYQCNGGIDFALIKLDLGGDYNHDGKVDGNDFDDSDEDQGPGLLLAKGKTTMISLQLGPSTLASGEVVLMAISVIGSGGQIKVWKSPAKAAGDLLIDSADLNKKTKAWDLSSSSPMGSVPQDLYVEGTVESSTYGDCKLFLQYKNPGGTVGSGTLICEDHIRVTVATAFVGRRFGGYPGHVPTIASSVKSGLGYVATQNESVSKANAIAAAPGKSIWYTLSDGVQDPTDKIFWGVIYGTEEGDVLQPKDLPAGLNYSLVFLNGCLSAQLNSDTPDAFKTAFNAKTYMGWKTQIEMSLAAGYGEVLFSELDGSKTITQAMAAALAHWNPGTYGYNKIAGSIRLIGDGNLVVDLTPP